MEHVVTKNTSRFHSYIADVNTAPLEMFFPRPARVSLNRLQSGVGLFPSTMHKWEMASTAACKCGANE